MLSIDYPLFDKFFCLVTAAPENSRYAVKASDLLQEEVLHPFLEAFRVQIKGLDLQVAGTYFAAWWRGICTAVQYMLSVNERMLDISLANLTLHLADRGGYPQVFFVLNDTEEKQRPGQSHEETRAAVLERFYGEQLHPLFQNVAAVSGLPLGQIWSQMPLGISYYLDLLEGRLDEVPLKERIREDYRYLAEELDPALFGLRRNPFNFKKKLIEDPQDSSKTLVMKPTCCLAYRTDTGYGYCSSCPKLSKEQRAQMFSKS